MRILIRNCASAFAALALGAGLALAAPESDPMKALAGLPAGNNPLDPMTALMARSDEGADAESNAELGGLPDGPGAEDTYYQCVACHSTEIIKQQRVTDHRWDELWTWMVEAQGMVEPDDKTKKVILTYLKENFSSER
ncbi:cytochrome C-552 [Paracoccus benzoatiresistens]|uniref:Cytochrome C-552 n=1 Tax=Paracoccus benzoatiresistens TaxID=2997341 RepID=A0ABT4JBG6_9RHOB|nr:cytochrome C-552 [Paracoccus sp. EF6]MCZ0964239.1 cytochrome C-552 [Paracoccus sp. EF6]